jgi:hypothetical protein
VELKPGQLIQPQLDSRFVEVVGFFRSFDPDEPSIRLRVGTENLSVLLPRGMMLPPGMVSGSKVRVLGAYGARFNTRRQMVGARIIVSGLGDIRLLEAGPASPFALPVTRIDEIGAFGSPADLGRFKVRGVVVLRRPGRGYFVQDDSGTVWVADGENKAPEKGLHVELVGFAEYRRFTPSLDGPVVRVLGDRPVLPPKEYGRRFPRLAVNANSSYESPDGEYVRIEARVAEVARSFSHLKVALQSPDNAEDRITAELPLVAGSRLPSNLEPGSVLRVTGVVEVGVVAVQLHR